jgi:colicin import membrane protein
MTEHASAVTCKFPGCENPPEPATARPGRPPEYCADPAHTPVTAWRERRRLADAERGITTSGAETEQLVTTAPVTGAELVRQMRDLADTLTAIAEWLTGTVASLGEPTAAQAGVEAARAGRGARRIH